MSSRLRRFIIAPLLFLMANSTQASAAAPNLVVARISQGGRDITSALDVTLRSLDGKVLHHGVKVGASLPDRVQVQIPADDTVVIANGRSTATLEPGSTDTFWYTGAIEMLVVNGGKTTVDDPLDFFQVRAQNVTAGHHTTIFSVKSDGGQITVRSLEGVVTATISEGEPILGGNKGALSYVSRVDSVSADGRSAVTYDIRQDATTAHVRVEDDKAAATRGDAESEFNLAMRYFIGDGVAENRASAFRWLELAAKQGNREAENVLGSMYFLCEGPESTSSASQRYEFAALSAVTMQMSDGFRDAASEWQYTGEPAQPAHRTQVASLIRSCWSDPGVLATAVRWIKLAADQGLADAQNNLGYMYIYGYGVDQNFSTGLEWYRRALAQGSISAETNFGNFYMNHYNPDYASALHWYQLAAARGDVDAIESIGEIYEKGGHGVARDSQKALHWLTRAAHQGDSLAMYYIGEIYHVGGSGVRQDYLAALRWYKRAGERFDTNNVGARIGNIYETGGHGVAADFKAAARWYNLEGMYGTVGVIYALGGHGIKKNYATALHYFRFAAAKGHVDGERYLGFMYERGTGVARNYATALHWYRLAAAQGDPVAENNIGFLYEWGHGVRRSFAEAFHWYWLAAEQGNARSKYHLGHLYSSGRGVRRSDANALYWFTLAAEQRDADAEYSIGSMCDYGRGVPQDYKKALHYYHLAAAHGNAAAARAIERLLSKK